MLVPKFRCFQDDNFIKVEIVLSALCKVAEAQFDILEHQFTFSCSPYFLRLTFPCLLTEERGERATYDLESNVLTVFVPKLNVGEDFPGLDFPNQLLATSRQRKEMGLTLVTEVDENGNKIKKDSSDNDEENDEEDDEEMEALETEFDQMLQLNEQNTKSAASAENTTTGNNDEKIYYGFNNQFTKFFAELDEDLTKELIDLPAPDKTLPLERKKLRKEDEDANFDEGAFLFSMNDEEGEIERDILPFKPWYVQCFEEALISAGRRQHQEQQQEELAKKQQGRNADGAEVQPQQKTSYQSPGDIGANFSAPTNDMISSKNDTIWSGNTIQMANNAAHANNAELMKVINDEESGNNKDDDASLPVEGVEKHVAVAATSTSTEEPSSKVIVIGDNNNNTNTNQQQQQFQQKSSRNGLAFTIPPPNIPDFTIDESTTLQTIPAKNFFLHSEALVCWQLCDILAATVYDILTTQGQGTVESSWTITKLSSCLSWMDTPQNAQEFADTFCRRVLTFPLHRHFGLALRCLRDVSLLLLSGPKTIVKVLLYTKRVVDACDTGSKHALSTLWINPLLSWLTSSFNTRNHNSSLREKFFIRTADELHGYVVRGEVLAAANNNAVNPETAANIGSRKNAAVLVQVVDPNENNNNSNNNQSSSSSTMWRGELHPLAWTNLKLPFSEELMAEVA